MTSQYMDPRRRRSMSSSFLWNYPYFFLFPCSRSPNALLWVTFSGIKVTLFIIMTLIIGLYILMASSLADSLFVYYNGFNSWFVYYNGPSPDNSLFVYYNGGTLKISIFFSVFLGQGNRFLCYIIFSVSFPFLFYLFINSLFLLNLYFSFLYLFLCDSTSYEI